MAKFKVGDKVRVKKDLIPYKDYKGNNRGGCPVTPYMAGKGGTVCTITGFGWGGNYQLSNLECVWCDEMLEPYKGFTKADLKDGMVVEYEREGKRLYLNGHFMDGSRSLDLEDFNYDLTSNNDCDGYTIVRVYETTGYNFNNLFDDRRLKLIWEREEHREMTVAEIEAKLGYKIRVVADKE